MFVSLPTPLQKTVTKILLDDEDGVIAAVKLVTSAKVEDEEDDWVVVATLQLVKLYLIHYQLLLHSQQY